MSLTIRELGIGHGPNRAWGGKAEISRRDLAFGIANLYLKLQAATAKHPQPTM
jgi:hypothetical protein